MAVSAACLCTRDDVMLALDMHPTQRMVTLVDRAIQSAVGDIHNLCHRRFIPEDGTKYFDWPNFQSAYPWRLWFEQYDLVTATSVSSGGTSIDLANCNFEPAEKEADEPYTYLELNRGTNAAFGGGSTPQRDIQITGTWGYSLVTSAAGALAAAMTDTTGTTAQVADGSQMGVGDILVAGTERMVVADRAMVTTTQTQQSGLTTASNSDVSLGVTDGTQYHAGETLLLDSERVYVTDIAGNILTVKRAWDGTVLAAHSGATIYASRLLTVIRGSLGTTAAIHNNASALSRITPPALVTELAIAISENSVLQKTSGYARMVGEGDSQRQASGAGLADLRAQVMSAYGRKARTAVI